MCTREVKNTAVGMTGIMAPYTVVFVESLYQSSSYNMFLCYILGYSLL